MGVTEVFVPHPEGVKEILRGEQSAAAMHEAVNTLAANVLHAVPVVRGGYLKAFTPSLVTDVQEDHDLGMVGYVGTTLGLWHLIEYGTATSTDYHPFGRGALASGLKWEPKGSG